jgi:hypothetical protein
VGNGPRDSDIRNDCNFRADRFDKIVGASFKSNDRCNDASDEWVGRYDARFLTRFQSSNSNRNNISIRSKGAKLFWDFFDNLWRNPEYHRGSLNSDITADIGNASDKPRDRRAPA